MPETDIIEVNQLSRAVTLSQIASEEDGGALAQSLGSIREAYTNEYVFRTETQMRISVLNDVRHPTAAAKLEQAYREMSGMATELYSLSLDYRLRQIDLEELEQGIAGASGFDLRRKEIEIEKLRFALDRMRKQAHHRIREIAIWDKLIKENAVKKQVPELVSLAVRYCSEVHAMEEMKASIPPADARNIYGLLNHAIKEVTEKGLMPVFIGEITKDSVLTEWCVKRKVLQRV